MMQPLCGSTFTLSVTHKVKKGGEDIELEIRNIDPAKGEVLWLQFLEIVRKLEEPILAMVLIYISN